MSAVIYPAELFAARLAARQARQFSEQIRKVWEEAAAKAGIEIGPVLFAEDIVMDGVWFSNDYNANSAELPPESA